MHYNLLIGLEFFSPFDEEDIPTSHDRTSHFGHVHPHMCGLDKAKVGKGTQDFGEKN